MAQNRAQDGGSSEEWSQVGSQKLDSVKIVSTCMGDQCGESEPEEGEEGET